MSALPYFTRMIRDPVSVEWPNGMLHRLRDPFSLGWWRNRYDEQQMGIPVPTLTPEGVRTMVALGSALERALDQVRSVLGDTFVDRSIIGLESAFRSKAVRQPEGFALVIGRSHHMLEVIRGGAVTLPFIDDAISLTLTAHAMHLAMRTEGVERVAARLQQPSGSKDAAFEIVVAGWFADRLGPERVRFIPTTRSAKTPDLAIQLTGDNWAKLECKRQKDQSGASDAISNARETLLARIRKLARAKSTEVDITVSSASCPDAPMIDWMVQRTRDALDSLATERQEEQTRAMADGSVRVTVRRRTVGDHTLRLRPEDHVPGCGEISSSVPIRHSSGPGISPPMPYVIHTSLGHHRNEVPLRPIIDRGSTQLPEEGGGALAIWSRAPDPQAWERACAAASEEMRGSNHSRIAGIYMICADSAAIFPPTSQIVQALRVRWIPNVTTKPSPPWPVGLEVQMA